MTTTKIQKSTQFGIGITSGLGMASAVGHVGYKISSMTSEELLRLLLTMGISKDVGYMVINAARSLANKIPGGSKSITVVASLASGLAAGYLATKHSQSIADFSLEAKIAEVRKQIKHKEGGHTSVKLKSFFHKRVTAATTLIMLFKDQYFLASTSQESSCGQATNSRPNYYHIKIITRSDQFTLRISIL